MAMAVVANDAVRFVALWLGDRRLYIGETLLDVQACAELENTMRSLRLVRRWDHFASIKMLVGIQNARVAFTRSSAILNCTILANHVEGLRADLRAADDRIDRLEALVLTREEIIDELRMEVVELNEAASEARRADRPEPDAEPEPDELM